MLQKKETSNTTAVIEYSIQEDDLTHPALYRFKRNNSPSCYTYHPKQTTPAINNNNDNRSKPDYDLYPSVMRDIKNHE
ncbi:hypothetical protein G6F70_002698 [Rhizopus microsporus]|uniref:Uncharacterized protein n=1 Tax=Rhizopus microsporus TaxID=58291 RepID=A0A1X0S7C9_RHIZD|nr:hypothetical protein G6F71_001272 [Rhizopus microsporus]KAG1201936.1 hypothetical protein G6F70_002698 [Rhizopus microsporus]KAG1215995.1 hypothetical protein G6F69_000525 [Rhizopus microsporus]ORE20048.1 hypothetical protein BCV71DRAFT_92721 [Rhizopus microsporus]